MDIGRLMEEIVVADPREQLTDVAPVLEVDDERAELPVTAAA